MNAMPTAPGPTADYSTLLAKLLIQVMERVTEFLAVERSTIFLLDAATQQLWSPIAQGTAEIRIPVGRGIAGHVFTTGETLRIADAYADPRFNASVDRSTGFRTRDLFCRPINDSQGRRIGVIQLLNRRAGDYTARDEALLDAICGQAGVAIENTQLLLSLKKVNDSEYQLRTELEAKHAELQKAFLRIEESAAAQALLGKKIQKVRLASMVIAVALFAAIGLFAWLGSGQGAPRNAVRREGTEIRWHTVTAAPVRTGIALLGNIEPLEVRNLTAPLRGRIAEKNFQYGELVSKGQMLARIDTTDAEIELRNAEAAAFKASVELGRLENWATGPEVARAQRDLLKARLSFEGNQRNLKEMEQLSQLGIIAQGSLESARQQFSTQETDYSSARENAENVLANASADRVRIARYDVENARVRMDDLRAKIAAATLHAPFDGLVILPNARPTAGRPANKDGFYEQGSTLEQGEILLALGNLEGVAVKTRADEVDIARLRHGQPVTVTGDAFAGHTLAGQVAYLSSQAILTGTRPYFELLVKTGRLSAEDLAVVRLGMTARLDITVYESPGAVVVPVSAVRRATGGNGVVFVRDGELATKAVAVTLGATMTEAVEIRAGLKVGDIIVANAKAVQP